MEPVYDIIPGFKIPDNEMVVYAKDQPDYMPLPAWRETGPTGKGLIVTRWKLTWKERFQILFGGSIWLSIFTFYNPLQPVKLDTTCPLMGSAMLDEEV